MQRTICHRLVMNEDINLYFWKIIMQYMLCGLNVRIFFNSYAEVLSSNMVVFVAQVFRR